MQVFRRQLEVDLYPKGVKSQKGWSNASLKLRLL